MMLTLAAIITIVALGCLFYRRISWGVASVVFLLPFERLGSFSLNPELGQPVVRLVQVAGAGLILGYFFRVIFKKEKLSYLTLTKWLAALSLISVVPVLLINYPPLWRDYISVLFVLSLGFTIAQLTARHGWSVVIRSAYVSAVAVILFGFYQFVGDIIGLDSRHTGLRESYSKIIFGFPRIHSTEAEPLFYANYLLFPFLMSLSWIMLKVKNYTGYAYALLILSAISIGLTTSRGGYVAALCGALIVIFYSLKLKKLDRVRLGKLSLASAVVIVAAFSGIATASYATHKNFLTGPKLLWQQSTSNATHTGSFTERKAAYSQALRYFSDRPLFGHGVGGYGYRVNDYPTNGGSQNRIAINNQPLELLLELGIIGASIYGALVIAVMKGAHRRVHDSEPATQAYAIGLIATLAAIMVQYLTFSAFYLTYVWVIIGLLGGLGVVSATKYSRIKKA